jgi:hypothetical protein
MEVHSVDMEAMEGTEDIQLMVEITVIHTLPQDLIQLAFQSQYHIVNQYQSQSLSILQLLNQNPLQILQS